MNTHQVNYDGNHCWNFDYTKELSISGIDKICMENRTNGTHDLLINLIVNPRENNWGTYVFYLTDVEIYRLKMLKDVASAQGVKNIDMVLSKVKPGINNKYEIRFANGNVHHIILTHSFTRAVNKICDDSLITNSQATF